LESYRRSGFDGNTIAGSFAQVAGWARSWGVPPDRILLGEFGARKTALQFSGVRAAERAQWFHDVRDAAEAQGFGWAAWTYKGPGFGLTQGETGDDLDPGIAEALGLNFRAQRKAAGLPPAGAADRRP
jgi:endoglucanase